MNVDTTISKNGCKPRGRPRKHPSEDQRMNARRERNRAAQKSFRLRHQANELLKRHGDPELENKFNQLLSVFLSFTDQVVHSEWANRDVLLMKALRCSVKDVLSLIDDSPSMTFKNSWQSEPGSNALGNSEITLNGVSISQQNSHIQPQPPLSDNRPPERQDLGVQVGELKQDIRQDIGLSTSIRFQPPSTGQSRLDSPFSLQIAYLAIQYAYHILSAATSPADDAISRVFGSRLQIQPRQDILLNLRWHLGPGYSQLDCLATANFVQPVVIDRHIELEDQQLYNADQIARILRQRTRGLAGDDCLDVLVNNGTSVTNKLVHAPVIQSQHTIYSNSGATMVIRVSKLGLLHNISRTGICFGSGPAFLGADVKKAIWDSVLPGSYLV
ncbi:hypothetical protein BHE90_009205 [Fusarium euwallaceae]|uniref:BZIP domain-containing protein n=1 Tax=Fusarium euwallaceae TaxID=1147111 RepID=A0A430LKR9_9HYPO|nr:hypothetical protein BHE90_009205 [Fusarium euwallaceae]